MPLYRQPKSPYWWVRFSVGGTKVRRSSSTTDRQAAEDFETKLRADLWRQVKLGERPRYTWAEAVKRWDELAEGRSKERERGSLRWFAQYLNETALVDIDRDLLEKLRKVKAAETSKANANRSMALLRMILRKAEREWDWIEHAPSVPMYSLDRAEPRYLTKAQFARLKRRLAPHMATLAEFSVETGLRQGNVCGLTWAQVDLRHKQLVIPAARAKAGETIAIPLSARAIAILRYQRGRHPERVFTYRGEPYRRPDWKVWKAAAEKAGVSWVRWHDLRHTWASWHVQKGTPLHVLRELGGWSSLAMVQRYAHLSTEHLRAFVEPEKGIPARKRA